MSARSRTAAGSRERGWSRAVPEVLCERPFPNRPMHSRIRTRSFGLSHGLCSVFPMISDLFSARIFGWFQVCDRLPFVSPHFWLYFSPTTGFRQASNHDRTASVGLSHKTHEFDGLLCRQPITSQYLRHGGATAPPQRRAATRLLCNCQDTDILTLQWSLCAGDLLSTHHCFEFQCSARQAQHAHAVFTRMSEHRTTRIHSF